MAHQFDITLTQADAEAAVKRIVKRRRIGPFLLAVCGLLLLALDLTNSKLEWISIYAVFLIGLSIFPWFKLRLERRRALQILQEQVGMEIHYLFDEQGMSTKSRLGDAMLEWATIHRLQIYPELWLITYGIDASTSLPASKIPAEAKKYFQENIRRSIGHITDYTVPWRRMLPRLGYGLLVAYVISYIVCRGSGVLVHDVGDTEPRRHRVSAVLPKPFFYTSSGSRIYGGYPAMATFLDVFYILPSSIEAGLRGVLGMVSEGRSGGNGINQHSDD